MKTLIIFILSTFILFASTPNATNVAVYTKALGAGSGDTTSVSGIKFSGDSVGILLEINQDSVSGKIVYEYTSVNGYTDGTSFASLPVLKTFSNNERAIFTPKIPMIAGADRVRLYILSTNNKSSLQTISYKVYSISWR